MYLRARYYNPVDGRFLSRDTWGGIYDSPQSLNRWNYTQSNPILYTDPSGRNPLAALVPALIGLGAGIAIGAAAGGAFGYAMYPWALSGQCGCEAQEQAKAAGDRWSYTGANALAGGLMGGYAVALGAATISTGALGGIIVGGIGFVAFGVDFQKTRNIIKNETGYTACTVTRLLIDLVGMTLSGVGVFKSVQAWRASGSGLELVPIQGNTIGNTFKQASSIPDDAFVAIQPSAADASIKLNGLDPQFSNTGEPYVYITQMRYVRNLPLAEAADGLKVPASKWTGQRVTLWRVTGNFDIISKYTGPGLGKIPQWYSAVPLPVKPYPMVTP